MLIVLVVGVVHPAHAGLAGRGVVHDGLRVVLAHHAAPPPLLLRARLPRAVYVLRRVLRLNKCIYIEYRCYIVHKKSCKKSCDYDGLMRRPTS